MRGSDSAITGADKRGEAQMSQELIIPTTNKLATIAKSLRMVGMVGRVIRRPAIGSTCATQCESKLPLPHRPKKLMITEVD